MTRELTEEETVERLIEAGWSQHEAEDEVKRMLREAAIEDGMDQET